MTFTHLLAIPLLDSNMSLLPCTLRIDVFYTILGLMATLISLGPTYRGSQI
jgi:hypothetical protein